MKKYTVGKSKSQALSLIPNGGIQLTKIGDKKVCISRKDELFYVFEAFCPHRMADLSQGIINHRSEIVCPLHGYQFDLNSGRASVGDCRDLKIYKCNLDENGLHIYVEDNQ